MSRRRTGRPQATRPTADEVRRVWASPQVLVALVLVAVTLVYAVGGRREPLDPPPPVPVTPTPTSATVEREVRYVVVDEAGLERPGFADVALAPDVADDRAVRLTSALAALRDDLVASGTWPGAVPAPGAFVFELDRAVIAVVDVAPLGDDASVSVAQEWAALRSIVATARVEVAADDVHVTVGGGPAPSLWGHVDPAGADR